MFGLVTYHDLRKRLIPPFFRYFCNTLSQRVGLVQEKLVSPILELCSEVGRMIHSLIGSLQRKLSGTGSEIGR